MFWLLASLNCFACLGDNLCAISHVPFSGTRTEKTGSLLHQGEPARGADLRKLKLVSGWGCGSRQQKGRVAEMSCCLGEDCTWWWE